MLIIIIIFFLNVTCQEIRLKSRFYLSLQHMQEISILFKKWHSNPVLPLQNLLCSMQWWHHL